MGNRPERQKRRVRCTHRLFTETRHPTSHEGDIFENLDPRKLARDTTPMPAVAMIPPGAENVERDTTGRRGGEPQLGFW